ncbi:MAG: helix-turn-helix domain-containing protein [Nitrospira sp.]
MSIGSTLQAWRLSRGQSLDDLAQQSGLSVASLEAIETGDLDPPASTLDVLAQTLGIPIAWLFGDPKQLRMLYTESDDDPAQPSSLDPVIERILRSAHSEREMYALLTVLLRAGDPKLLRAAEMSLRSLVKQSKQATVPWQSRPSGHFEPPSD